MKEMVFLLEEASARELVAGLYPRVVPEAAGIRPRYIVFEGKQDLEKQMERRPRVYLNPEARFLVLRDQDSADCRRVKEALRRRCDAAGRPSAVVRIACRELEAFYLRDPAAVERAFRMTGLARRQEEQKFRKPDRLGSPSLELEKLTRNRYQKVSGFRAIAPHLELENARSESFRQLVEAMRRLAREFSETRRRRRTRRGCGCFRFCSGTKEETGAGMRRGTRRCGVSWRCGCSSLPDWGATRADGVLIRSWG